MLVHVVGALMLSRCCKTHRGRLFVFVLPQAVRLFIRDDNPIAVGKLFEANVLRLDAGVKIWPQDAEEARSLCPGAA
eukprot:scaffold207137_cov28-Tisochrysis_lutea.AAC.3